MIKSMVCTAYKLKSDYVVHERKKFKVVIEKCRIFLFAKYNSESNKREINNIWILATPRKTAVKVSVPYFEAIKQLDLLEKIDIQNEHHWLNNHLNKQVRFYLRQSNYLESKVLIEKYKEREVKIIHYTGEFLDRQMRLQNRMGIGQGELIMMVGRSGRGKSHIIEHMKALYNMINKLTDKTFG